MKIVVFPDIHQTTHWAHALKKIDFDKIDKFLFLGDYFDCWENKWPLQLDNFKMILKFKESMPDRVDVLWGNHDTSYFLGEKCSGFQPHHELDIQEFIMKNRNQLEVVAIYDKFIFSHGGVSQTWLKLCGLKDVTEINQLFKERPNFFRWAGPDPFGNNKVEGPLWIRPGALMETSVKEYNQIVGHTEVDKLKWKISPNSQKKVLCIDSRTHENIILLDTEKEEFKLI